MRIASISLVKDEADILEAFIRHNLHFVDRMYVVDDRSSDNTAEILRRLAAETDAVAPLDDGWTGAFHQARRTTAVMQRLVADDKFDVILALDADEMICAADRAAFEAAIEAIPSGMVGGFDAIQYVAVAQDDPAITDPLKRVRTALPASGHLFKSFAVRPFDPEITYGEGNHFLHRASFQMPTHLLPGVSLAHFPIRSVDQIAIKCLKHYVGWRSRSDYQESLSSHLMKGARALSGEPRFALAPSSEIIEAYLGFDAALAQARPFVERRGELRWPELAVVSPYIQLLGLFDRMIEQAKQGDAVAMTGINMQASRELADLKGSRTKLFEAYLVLVRERIRAWLGKRLKR